MLLTKQSSGARWHLRPDGPDKVTGALKYLTDMQMEGMLYGKVLRSPHPHAWILAIRTERAERLPGVRAVITHLDVPGMNRFGIAIPDQPVLCEDHVRYVGDAVAAVAAETEELAELALTLIEVDYEPLQVVDDPEAALLPNAPRLHPGGNVLHRSAYKRGDVKEGFARCAHVVEETYYTPRQMHAYMETEGGLFVPEEEGRLTVYAPTQHGFKDRMQLGRILAVPDSQIRVVSSPIGGSFGGKDELNVQPYGALLALKTGKPVKMHQSRWESVRAGLKRHPMKITMRTGIDDQGKLIAHQVRIVADTGAYATLGPAVLNFCAEHVLGPYLIVHTDVEGVSVYTNNGVSGEFRGFGGNQAIYALEGQLDRLAEAAGMDPWRLRRINVRGACDAGPMGQRIVPTDGAVQVWEALERSPIWERRSALSSNTGEPWLRRGIGAALVMHGSGLGFGIPDPAGGRLLLNREGKIEAAFGYEEFGQGVLATLEIMLLEHFHCEAGDLRLVIGDTDLVPSSGSSTASRVTSMLWHSLNRLVPVFLGKLLARASELTGIPPEQLCTGPGGVWQKSQLEHQNGSDEPVLTYLQIAEQGTHGMMAQTQFHFPITPDAVTGGHYLYTYSAVAVEVEVNTLTGKVRVIDQHHVVAAGPVVNPMGYIGQIEGGNSMALGFTLSEDAVMQEGHYLTKNLDTYLIPTIRDVPAHIQVEAIDELPLEDIYGPRGVGEIGTIGPAPAICSAIHHAVGKWITRLPIDSSQLIEVVDWTKGEGSL
ncbi:xanthine dehydrogenase subunit D [Paenibacillus rigui]|uniref:Xanthine dehydrogenase subunit D n=1 Tax=Paenibacillus rigui TaxID=554312 RepID=A0A229UWM6_9BACL|nr:xanthine dehydrogenase subunit D [Paenibacillus rigui]OXM87770.1 xanthine dehydrogenase subunit D [Paenibacillus rigui]